MQSISLGQPGGDDQQQITLRGVHENFARELASSLSSFLQAEIGVRLDTIASQSAADFHASLPSPSCVVSFQLEPRADRALLFLDCATVFSLLELLMGVGLDSGQLGSAAQERNFTEIEWALLEEIVRVVVACLGDAWKTFHAVEFKVLELENDPRMLPVSDPTDPTTILSFALDMGEHRAGFQIAVPKSFFESAPPGDSPQTDGSAAEIAQRNLALLGEAKVSLQVILEGPAMELRQLAALRPGQVVRFDYPLQKPLRAMANDSVAITCQMVTAGKKRAFQVERLP